MKSEMASHHGMALAGQASIAPKVRRRPPPGPQPLDRKPMTAMDAPLPTLAFTAEMLAKRWSCSPRTVRNLFATGKLPAFRLGGKLLRISQAAIERFEQCQNIDSSASEESSLSHGTKADAAFVTHSALIAARKQTSASLAS
jgi:excisionase family DNA binding protein